VPGSGTKVSAGTLSISNDNNLGSGNVGLDGGTLQATDDVTTSKTATLTNPSSVSVDTSKTLILNGTVNGSDKLTKTGVGTLTLGANNSATFSGVLGITAGTVSVSAANNLGSGNISLDAGTLLATETIAPTNTASLDSASTVNVAATKTLTLNGAVSGSNKMTKSGTGTLTLAANNSTFSGGFDVEVGTVSASAANNLGSGNVGLDGGTLLATETIAPTNTVSLDSASTVNVAATKNLTLNGIVSGTNILTKIGTGILTLGANNSTFSGGFDIEVGTLSVNAANNLGTANIDLDGGTLLVTDDITATNTASVSTASPINVNSGKTFTLNGVVTGTNLLTKSGTGTLALGANNAATFSGGIDVSAGTRQFPPPLFIIVRK